MNFFLYIFPPLLDLMNVDETLIEIHSTLAQFYERFNSKNPLNHTNYLELIEWKGRIYKTIKLMGTRISSKIRSLLQYPFFILLNGLMWNYNSAVFESYLNSVKQAARETKKNPLLSLINYFSNIWSLNLFKSFPRNFYETLNFPTRKINFVMDYICEEKEKDLTFPTKLLTNFQYSSNGEIKTKSFYSYKRNHFITSFGKKLIISTHSSSQKLDNNDQYFIIDIEGSTIFARIEAIKVTSKEIFYKQGVPLEEDKLKIHLGRMVKVTFSNSVVQKTQWGNLKEKMVGSEEIKGVVYLIKIVQ